MSLLPSRRVTQFGLVWAQEFLAGAKPQGRRFHFCSWEFGMSGSSWLRRFGQSGCGSSHRRHLLQLGLHRLVSDSCFCEKIHVAPREVCGQVFVLMEEEGMELLSTVESHLTHSNVPAEDLQPWDRGAVVVRLNEQRGSDSDHSSGGRRMSAKNSETSWRLETLDEDTVYCGASSLSGKPL